MRTVTCVQVMCPTCLTAPCAPAPEMPPGSRGQVRGIGAGGRCQLGGCALIGAGTPGNPPVAFPFAFPQQERTDGPSGCRTAAAASALPAVLPSLSCAAATTAVVVGRYGGVAGPGVGLRGRGSTRRRSLSADLLRPLLAARRCAATLRPAETCACLHALPRHAPPVLAYPHPLRGPGCGTWPWGCWADPVPVGPGGRRTAHPAPSQPGAAPSPGLETCLVAVLLRCVFCR